MRILLAELELEGKVEVLSGIFPQKFPDMFEHGIHFSDSEWTMVDGERLLLIDPEIEVPESGLELIFDIPCLALIDDANFGTCLLYTSPSPRDLSTSRMPSSA